MTEKIPYEIKPLKSNLRNNLLVSFFLVVSLGGIAANAIFLNVIQVTLSAEGLDPGAIERISRHYTLMSTSVTIAGILAILLIALLLSEKITRPLKKLTAGMIDISNGRWDTRLSINSTDEIGQLADGFNFMVEHIEGSLHKLKLAKEYTDNIVISVPSILIVLNSSQKVLSTNIAFDRLHEQFPTLSLKQFVLRLKPEIMENLQSGETIKEEIDLSPEGTKVNLIFSTVISRIGDTEKESYEDAPRVLLTITDITERKKMRELVFQSKQDWEDTFNTIPDMITIHDENFNIIHANTQATEILKLPLVDPERINKCYKYYHGSESAPPGCPSCDCMNSGVAATFEVFEPHLNKFIEIRAIPRINNSNKLIGLIHIVRDISHKKKAEEERNHLLTDITKAKIEWELTFDSAMEFIVLIDKDMNITRCNKSFSEFFKQPVSEIVGNKCYEYFPCSSSNVEECRNNLVSSNELSLKSELKMASGKWLYVSHRPIHDDKSKTLHSVIIATDITELKNAQQTINESEKELKKKVEDLERFYDLAVGREIRMKDLKKEIKKANTKLEYYEENVTIRK